MKKLIYIGIALLLTGCDKFLSEYSQDLIVAKTVMDYDELLLGSVYMPSYSYGGDNGVNMPSGTVSCSFLNVLDDDINTVKTFSIGDMNLWRYCVKSVFGYTTWQWEVGRSLDGQSLTTDDVTWRDLYSRINIVNVILDEIDDLSVSTEEEAAARIRVKGECHFLRAQFYFILVNLYGKAYSKATAETTLGVPLKLTGYVEHEQGKPTQFNRAPLAEVYGQVIKDLIAAINYLYESPQANVIYRVSVEAAQVLLSRVYLYMQDWENVRKVAGDFLESRSILTNILTMGENEDAVFLNEENSEVLFSQSSLTLQGVLRAQGGGDFCVSEDLFSTYDTLTDKRAKLFFTRGRDSIALGNKYPRTNIRSKVSDVLMLRTAEVYLNMAEACAMLDDGEANHWLNSLRRTRIKDYQDQSYSGEELVKQIRGERRKELCFEGHRWFDLRRYAVNEKYPFKRKITRYFSVYDENQGGGIFTEVQKYTLLEDDPAYTFAIPKSVLEFDIVGMPDNERNKREVEENAEGLDDF